MTKIKETIVALDLAHLKDLIRQAIEVDGHECDLNFIDVSQVTNMSHLFNNALFNGNISAWDTSKVMNMSYMFTQSAFLGDISKWNVSSVTTMSNMFQYSYFNGDLSKWDVSKVQSFDLMFYDCRFNNDLSLWSIKPNASSVLFCSYEELSTFKKPSAFHWISAFENVNTSDIIKTWPKEWQTHFHTYAPPALGLASSNTAAAVLIQHAWHNQLNNTLFIGVPELNFELSL